MSKIYHCEKEYLRSEHPNKKKTKNICDTCESSFALITELTRIIQRLEREKVDLTVDDIKTVWKAKRVLGYSCPISIEEGTGSMVNK